MEYFYFLFEVFNKRFKDDVFCGIYVKFYGFWFDKKVLFKFFCVFNRYEFRGYEFDVFFVVVNFVCDFFIGEFNGMEEEGVEVVWVVVGDKKGRFEVEE